MRVRVAALQPAYIPSPGLLCSFAALSPAVSTGVVPFSAYEKLSRSRGTHRSITKQHNNTLASNNNRGIDNCISTTDGTTCITASSLRSCSSRDSTSISFTLVDTSVLPCRLANKASTPYAASSPGSCVPPVSLNLCTRCSVAGINHPTLSLNLDVVAGCISTLIPGVPSAKDSRSQQPAGRHARTPASLNIVGRFADAASTVSSSIAHVPESVLREVFVSALAVDSAEEGRGRGLSRAAAGGGPTGKISAEAKAPLGRLFRALLRSGVLHKFGPASLLKEGTAQQEASKQRQQQADLHERKEADTQNQQKPYNRGSMSVGRRDTKQQISFNFLTEVYNEGNFYARWGAGAQLVKTAGVKGLRPPGAYLRGGIADASPKPMDYEEFRAFVRLVLLRLADQRSGLLPLCRTAQSAPPHCSL